MIAQFDTILDEIDEVDERGSGSLSGQGGASIVRRKNIDVWVSDTLEAQDFKKV